MTTRPSFRAEFKASEGGKAAVSMARCVNTQGERGSWSEVCAATAAAGSPNSRVRSSGARPASSPPLLCRKTGDARHSRVREVTRLDQPAYRGFSRRRVAHVRRCPAVCVRPLVSEFLGRPSRRCVVNHLRAGFGRGRGVGATVVFHFTTECFDRVGQNIEECFEVLG